MSSALPGGDAPPFAWPAEWYPVAPVQDLARDRPNKLTLLGMDLVVWRHAPSDTWRVFRDVCPHRLVPLSEGRVEPSGVLQCAYHGWEFGETGACVRIPQLGRGLCEDSPSVRSERACAVAFPAQVRQGLLWVFPTADEALAGAKAPALIPELDDPSFVDATDFFVRDMPYSWEVLVENLCDPAHIPFAHHSLMNGAGVRQWRPPGARVRVRARATGFGRGVTRTHARARACTPLAVAKQIGWRRWTSICTWSVRPRAAFKVS